MSFSFVSVKPGDATGRVASVHPIGWCHSLRALLHGVTGRSMRSLTRSLLGFCHHLGHKALLVSFLQLPVTKSEKVNKKQFLTKSRQMRSVPDQSRLFCMTNLQ